MTPARRDGMPLTRDRIIGAGLALIDEAGVDALSMRRLGERLGVDPMAIYYYVPTKAALYDGIVEQVWMGVALPDRTADESWVSILYALGMAFRRRLLAHPRAVVLVGTRPTVSPTMLRVIDASLGRLKEAGLRGPDAMQLIDCISAFTIGKVLAEIGEPLGGPASAVEEAMAGVSMATHPHLVGSMADGYGFRPDEEFERGLWALLAGWDSPKGPAEGRLP